MDRLAQASFKSVGSIFAPGMLGVFVMSMGLTLLALILFVAAATSASSWLSAYISDPIFAHWLPWLSGFGAMGLAYFLFPGIMPIFINFFDSRIATLIEQQDYPLAQPINPPFWPEMWHDVRFSLVAITLNILVLPLYLTGIGILVFFLLNGHLLGKEFFVMVARRYLPLRDALELRRRHSRMIFIGGILLTVMATVPLLNLLAPFWGIAVMTHLYHNLARTPQADLLPPV